MGGAKGKGLKEKKKKNIQESCPRKLRSRLKDINLAILCRSKHITTYGYNQILAPFMNDIKVLKMVAYLLIITV